MICVVIPYFQRSEGILRRALASVAAQLPVGIPIHVIVVDDSSPAPALVEVEAIHGAPYSVQVIKQTNAGPGAARNTGLDHAMQDCKYVAFLDSDDEWSPHHLQHAVASLAAGFDFYFADHMQLGADAAAFTRGGRLAAKDHSQIPGLPEGLHRYTGDLLDQTIRGNLIGTSTVVYDFSRFKTNRFRVEFTNAGEDYLFWMELAHAGARVALSTHCEATYGRGVNVYAASGWGTDQHLLRIHNEMKYRRLTMQLFPLATAQVQHIRRAICDLRVAFARALFHRIGRRHDLPWDVLRKHFKLDPVGFLTLPFHLLKAVAQRQ